MPSWTQFLSPNKLDRSGHISETNQVHKSLFSILMMLILAQSLSLMFEISQMMKIAPIPFQDRRASKSLRNLQLASQQINNHLIRPLASL